ncbi:hypothetical protein QU481_23280 [Crenobacter sp. SG2303]|uniref:Uncharacterized protein n=1 Tax=Crenobacter oryzisoli TaxID=3056844 RepID=A0ABT7XVA1_9NEIS|nr:MULTISPECIES: hypothetical protein [unclassified Crenobacter]MDN0077733.1 hypothetical protein [Crenobacter sp. SG2303]MDN0085740.1 hypothetical protein [Crenobacter sp. SG2305]
MLIVWVVFAVKDYVHRQHCSGGRLETTPVDRRGWLCVFISIILRLTHSLTGAKMLIAKFDADLLLGEGPEAVGLLPESEVKGLQLAAGQQGYQVGSGLRAFLLAETLSLAHAFIHNEEVSYDLFTDQVGLDLELDDVLVEDGLVKMTWRSYGAIVLAAKFEASLLGFTL